MVGWVMARGCRVAERMRVGVRVERRRRVVCILETGIVERVLGMRL